ncbi:MAG: CRISPR-associated endonuclease Cas1 [bacterium]|nr:CRISPR-associated endonuclease Cas1 [bacterium]
MDSVVVSKPGVFLGKTSERLVVRGPKPRLELVDGGPQLLLPFEIPPPQRLTVLTSAGERTEPARLRGATPKPRTQPEQVELPLFRVSEIIVTGAGVTLSTDLIQACCERGIRLAFLSSAGRPIAMVSSPMLTATVITRRAQMAAYTDDRGLTVAQAVVRGKLGNQAALLKYFGKYQKGTNPDAFARLSAAVKGIEKLRREVDGVEGASIDDARPSLLALEGSAGRHYWAGIRALLEAKTPFAVREHRGATDPVNAALNYGYGILYTQVWGAIMNAGLEPFAGFLHVDRPGKPSLVLDLIEEFRQPIVDRAVVSLVTKGTSLEMRGGLLTDDGRHAVAASVIERLEGEVGFRGRRHRIKSVIQIQARNLATSLRDRTAYRAFAFKW